MDSLEIGTGKARQVIPLRGIRFTVGRAEGNDLRVSSDMSVSRRHAVLEKSQGGWKVRDLGSSNGTYINGMRVDAPLLARYGDSILIGDFRLVLLDDNDGDTSAPTTLTNSELDRVGLTSREVEVLRFVAAGMSDAQIAGQLTISVRTVHSHLEHIRNKTGLRRRTELARYAITKGL